MRVDSDSVADGGFERGDIVRAFVAHPNLIAGALCNLKKKSYILITDVPNAGALKLKKWLEESEDDAGNASRKRRILTLTVASLNASMRNKLLNPPYFASVTWTQAKGSVLKHKNTLVESTLEDESIR